MKVEKRVLIEDLMERCKKAINAVQSYRSLTDEQLNWKPNSERWSILECMEHLNCYGRFYIPEMKQKMIAGKKFGNRQDFKSGWLGNYFANSMLPKAQLNKMKTFKSMNPAGSNLTRDALEEMLQQQKQLLDLLTEARVVDLVKIKTGVTISKWITLRLGDTFRVVIYHTQRHLVQMEQVLQQQNQ